METIAIAIISTVAFGAMTTLAAFVRQLLLSRDKRLNDSAQQRALEHEIQALEQMRNQISDNKRFNSHYKLLNENKEETQLIDNKIERILEKKFSLIQHYSKATVDSLELVGDEESAHRKKLCDKLRNEIDGESASFNQELARLQKIRGKLLKAHRELQKYLLEQEKIRNEKLDEIYQRHTLLLEKIYIRHNLNSEHIAAKCIDSSMNTFHLITEPIRMLLQFLHLTSNINPGQAEDEIAARNQVADIEEDINSHYPSDMDDDVQNEVERVEELEPA